MNERWNVSLLLLLVLLLTVELAAGCKPAEPEENCGGGIRDSGDDKAVICTDKSEYQYGDMVHVRFTFTNLSDRSLDFDGGNEAAMDICERDICWSDEQEQISELTHLVLAPGESRTIEWTWPPSQEYLDKWLGRARLRWLEVSFSGVLRYTPHHRPSSVGVYIKYYPEGNYPGE